MSIPASNFSAEAVDADLEEPQYFPFLSGLALFTGLLSSLALGYPPFTIAAFVAVLLGLIALIPKSGFRIHPAARGMAMLGIVLGFFFAATSLTNRYLEKQRLTQEAERFARDWLEVLRTKEYEFATELTLQRGSRQFAATNLKQHYAGLKEENRSGYEAVLNLPVVEALELTTKKPVWKRVGDSNVSRYFTTHRVEIRMVDETGGVPQPVDLVLKRESDTFTTRNEWWVAVSE